jgi:adenylosuccinate synthase
MVTPSNYSNVKNSKILLITLYIISLAITKLDVLDDFPEIQIGVNYTINGQKIKHFPSSQAELGAVVVSKQFLATLNDFT